MFHVYQEAQTVIDRILPEKPVLSVLEAGCGSYCYVTLPKGSHLVGIDISARQLERNEIVHEKICGDLQTYELPEQSYDVIVCWDVLEHLSTPELALSNFVRSIRPGGLIILALPNVLSTKGLIAKFTPHRFHVWVYRTFMGRPNAGTEDVGPFKTYLRSSIEPHKLTKFAIRNRFEISFFQMYESPMQKSIRSKSKLISFGLSFIRAAGRVLTLGRTDLDLSDTIIVLRKPDSVRFRSKSPKSAELTAG